MKIPSKNQSCYDFFSCNYQIIVTIGLFFIFYYFSTDHPSDNGMPPYPIELIAKIQDFGNQIAKNHHIHFVDVKTKFDEDTCLYSISFSDSHDVNLKQGRLLATQIVEDFAKMLEKDPLAVEYRKSRHNHNPKKCSSLFDTRTISFHIDYWHFDKYGNSFQPAAPYLASINFFDDSFHYYITRKPWADPTIIFTETYDDAIKFKNATLK